MSDFTVPIHRLSQRSGERGMTWQRFLAALAEGGWSTDMDVHGDETFRPYQRSGEIVCRSTRGNIDIVTRWKGLRRTFAGAKINGLDASHVELAVALAW